MSTLILIVHIIVCFELIIVVLLQAGKGNALGGLFGGGSSQTVFGAQTGNVLTKITTASAIIFMITSLLLTIVPVNNVESIVKQEGQLISKPATPAKTEKKEVTNTKNTTKKPVTPSTKTTK